jgi:hypothetical protein
MLENLKPLWLIPEGLFCLGSGPGFKKGQGALL